MESHSGSCLYALHNIRRTIFRAGHIWLRIKFWIRFVMWGFRPRFCMGFLLRRIYTPPFIALFVRPNKVCDWILVMVVYTLLWMVIYRHLILFPLGLFLWEEAEDINDLPPLFPSRTRVSLLKSWMQRILGGVALTHAGLRHCRIPGGCSCRHHCSCALPGPSTTQLEELTQLGSHKVIREWTYSFFSRSDGSVVQFCGTLLLSVKDVALLWVPCKLCVQGRWLPRIGKGWQEVVVLQLRENDKGYCVCKYYTKNLSSVASAWLV